MDFFLSHEGDLVIGDGGTLVTTDGVAAALQAVAFIVKTARGDYALSPTYGSLLHTLVGELLTPQALLDGEAFLRDALLREEALLPYEITVRGVPVNATQALFLITVAGAFDGTRQFTIPFDFTHGVVELRDPLTIGTMPTIAEVA